MYPWQYDSNECELKTSVYATRRAIFTARMTRGSLGFAPATSTRTWSEVTLWHLQTYRTNLVDLGTTA